MNLFEKTKYKASGSKQWKDNFWDVVDDVEKDVSLDIKSIISYLSFKFPFNDGTLIENIKKNPWMSRIKRNGDVELKEIPKHGSKSIEPEIVTDNLIEKLTHELLDKCKDKKKIYILLSGGLDSRIIAALVAKLRNDNLITSNIIAVTWGITNSRDVYYAKIIANLLSFSWHHILLEPNNLIDNIQISAKYLGSLVSPINLHGLNWFKNVDSDSLILASIYGDSVGRNEFGGKRMVELNFLNPRNALGLINNNIFNEYSHHLENDINRFYKRSEDNYRPTLCALHQYSTRLRGLAHGFSFVDNFCEIYFPFTNQDVYEYMWALHPILRNDEIYKRILVKLDSNLTKIPWARTNKTIKGKSRYTKRGLSKDYHNYEKWISHDVFDEINSLIDKEWLKDTGIFDINSINKLTFEVSNNPGGLLLEKEFFIWLASFCEFNRIAKKNFNKCLNLVSNSKENILSSNRTRNKNFILTQLRRSYFWKYIFKLKSSIQKYLLRLDAIKTKPIDYDTK